jgi:hypothetical protein
MKNGTLKVEGNTQETESLRLLFRGETKASSDTLEISLLKQSLIEVESRGVMHV